MVVGPDELDLRLFDRSCWPFLSDRNAPRRTRHAEREMAVVAFVDRFDEVKSGLPQYGSHLEVRHARATGNVDGLTGKMIAVGNAADSAVMRLAAIDARYQAIARGKARSLHGLEQR